jgi:two-component system nitrate/nitrite response regulator NarL
MDNHHPDHKTPTEAGHPTSKIIENRRTTMQTPIRIMIVDDHAVIRTGLRMLIEQDQTMTVVAMAGTPAEALALAESERPDIIILDLILGEEDGLDFLPELCKVGINSRVLVLKQQAAELLLKAIRKVHQGEVWIDRSMIGNVLMDVRSEKREEVNPEAVKIKALTARELEVIALVSEGLKNKIIGERLFISETTVTHHLSSIYSKLGVSDRLELVVFAFANSLAKKP